MNDYLLMQARVVNHYGGKCIECGSTEDGYHFHHRDPSTKEFKVSSRFTTGLFETIIKEADKCDMLCEKCHRKRHPEIYKCDVDGLNIHNRWRLTMSREERIAYLNKRREIRNSPCGKEKAKLYREQHHEEILRKSREYHVLNRDKKIQYYEDNKDRILGNQKEYYEKNKDQILNRQHNYNITKRRENRAKLFATETPEEKAARLKHRSEQRKLAIMNETPEQRAHRLQKKKESYYKNKNK